VVALRRRSLFIVHIDLQSTTMPSADLARAPDGAGAARMTSGDESSSRAIVIGPRTGAEGKTMGEIRS
jgi:hypothetical protein